MPATPTTPPASTPTQQGSSEEAAATPEDVQFVSPPQDPGEALDAEHDEDAPLRFRAMEDVVGPGTPPGYDVRDLGAGRLLVVSAEEPASVKQAMEESCWRQAMEEELKSLEDNKTWSLTELPQGREAIGLKWVFKVKKDENGKIVGYKARLVVKGYAQREGIDYIEVFAPVARMETVRLLLALAADEG